ncbi:unnamed protein product [Malus baccata var. baccata]
MDGFGPVEEPMDLEKIEMVGDGEEDDMMISGGKILGIDEAQNDIENPYDPVLEALRNSSPLCLFNPNDPFLEALCNLSPLSPFLCICRHYTPRVVSIGPLHHGLGHLLKAMEEHRIRYLRDFLSRTRVSFFDYIQMIEDQEGRLRASYAEPIEFDSYDFVRIVLVDAAFVIEFFLRYYFVELQGEAECIFNKPMMVWDVCHSSFFRFFSVRPSLSLRTVSSVRDQVKLLSNKKVQHFVDLIRNLYLPLKSKPREVPKTTAVPKATAIPNATATVVPQATAVPNVTVLQVEVKFRVRKDSSDLFDIKFSNGILEIPRLTIDDTTDRKLRNLVAFEQCHCKEENYLSNYIFLMKRLMKTPEAIPRRYLVCEDLNKYYIDGRCKSLTTGVFVSKFRWYKWKTTLRKYYFGSPWSIISVVAAVILLVLTFIQTLCSVKSTA